MKTIREVSQEEEIQTVVRLAREIWTEHYTPLIGEAQVEYMLEKFQSPEAIKAQLEQGVKYHLLLVDKTPAGYMALEPEADRGKLKLSKIYVRGGYRGRGCGSFLLEQAKKEAKTQNVERIWLRVNKHNETSMEWYKKKGFTVASEDKKPIGGGFYMDDFIMELTLN